MIPLDEMKEFGVKYKLGEKGLEELQALIDKTLIHVSQIIISEKRESPGETSAPVKKVEKVKRKRTSTKGKIKCKGKAKKSGNPCRYYALENSDFCNLHKPKEEEEEEEEKDKEKEVIEVICNGMVEGKPCKQKGIKTKPEGSQFEYCFKHKSQWRDYEGEDAELKENDSTDSSIFDDTKDDDDDDDDESESLQSNDLNEDQELERVANDMTVEEYKKSVSACESEEVNMQKKMNSAEFEEWKKNQELDDSQMEKALEKVVNKEESTKIPKDRKKKTQKRPKVADSFLKKQGLKMARDAKRREEREKELLGSDNSE